MDIPTIVRAMDDVLQENSSRHALEEQREMSLKYRNIGIGILGLADMLVMLGIKYGSQEAIITVSKLMETIFRTAVLASAELAGERGSFPGYSEKVWDSAIIRNAFDDIELTQLKKKNALRNCSLISIAPTGSIGTMLNVSTGCESFFALNYTRKTVSLNNQESYYTVDIKAVEDYKRITGNTILPNYFVTSADINYKDRIKMQAALQRYTDTAISSTINLPKDTTVEDIKILYKYAWKWGLKGVTIFRESSREPILSTESQENHTIDNIQLEPIHTLERGDIIGSSNDCIGLKRTLTTGCGSLHCTAYFEPINGELRECYLSKGSTGGCLNFMVGLSRMISLAARGGIKIDNILDQLKSCGVCPSYAVRSATTKDTSKGSCCPVAVGNALKDMAAEMQEIVCKCNNSGTEYTPQLIKDVNNIEYAECPNCHEKTLVHTGGCVSCQNCSYTRCE